MPPVKGDFAPFPKRLELLLQLFSPWRNKPLTYGEFAERLGAEFTEDAVKSWAKRGEFSAAARERLVELALEQGVDGVTLAWLRTGAGAQPHRGVDVPPGSAQERRSVREPSRGNPMAGPDEEDAAYLRFTLQMTRELSAAEREGASQQVLLRLVDLAEKVAVPIHGKRAKHFLDDERDRIRRGETLDGRGDR